MSSQMLRLDDFTEPFYSYNNVFIIVIMFSSQKAVQTGVTRFGRLDCLINNVGVRKFVYGTAAVADNNGVVCDELDDNDDDGGGDDGVDSGGGDTDDDVDDDNEDADGGDNADGGGGDFKMQMYILMTTTMTSAIEIIFFTVRLLRGHSGFSSPPQRPITYDFEGFLYQILSITLFSYLNS